MAQIWIIPVRANKIPTIGAEMLNVVDFKMKSYNNPNYLASSKGILLIT